MRRGAARISAIVLCAALVAFAALAAQPVLAQEPEHLPKRARPPLPGELPAGLAPYAVRVAAPARSDAERAFDRIADDFLRHYLRAEPIEATALGFVEYDALMPPTDSAGIASSLASLDSLRARIAALDCERLGTERRATCAQLAAFASARSQTLRAGASWKSDPSYYVALAGASMRNLLARSFLTLEERGWNVVARLTQVPGVLRDARANLDRPSCDAVGRAVKETETLAHFLGDELPIAMAPTRDPILREEFDHHLASATGAVGEYRHWLKTVLVARCAPDSTAGGATTAVAALSADAIRSLLADRRPSRP